MKYIILLLIGFVGGGFLVYKNPQLVEDLENEIKKPADEIKDVIKDVEKEIEDDRG